ncbi:hypothetical protein SDC9_154721 [bioreactor metagenome]|uniref:Uncharacterized protein n=1 Tax=bioreactor metagenome TaxID=1076179 RepID=A0A645EZI5_9ZZZZ
MHFKADVKHMMRRQVIDLQRDISDFMLRSRIIPSHFATNHHSNNFFIRDFCNVCCAYGLSIPKNDDTIRDARQFG